MDTEYTEASMQKALKGFISSPKYRLENLYIFGWESDLLFMTPSKYWYEIEIKISRADFFNDAKKIVYSRKKSEVLADPDSLAPNYFYYAVPEGLLSVDEIPPYAGLIEVNGFFNVKKMAPKLRGKVKVDQSFLADKFYYNWKNEVVNRNNKIKECQDLRRIYSDVDKTIKNEVSRSVVNERYLAVNAFKSTCPHFDNQCYTCEKIDRESVRCGWCDRIKDFEKKLYQEQ